MYSAWLVVGDYYKEVVFPDRESWISQIVLGRDESGWDEDVYIEVRALEGKAYIRPRAPLTWRDGKRKEWEIDTTKQFHIVNSKNNCEFTVIIRKCAVSELNFQKYALPNRKISIGRADQCDIKSSNSFMSSIHGYLGMTQDGYAKYIDQSSNGSYINGRKIIKQSIRLNYGDKIEFPSGLKIMYLGSFIAVNQPKGTYISNLAIWKKDTSRKTEMLDDSEVPDAFVEYFRSPRMLKPSTAEDVELEFPIAKQTDNQVPILLQLGPSMTMVLPMAMGTIIGTGQFTLSSGIVMIGMSSMLAVMWALINRKYRDHSAKDYEEKRTGLYRKYIAEMESQLQKMNYEEAQRLTNTHPSVALCANMIDQKSHDLWNRMPNHPDFLDIRVGVGEVEMPCTISYPKEKLSLIDDPLRNEPERLKNTYGTVKDAPVSVSLRTENVIGILGNTQAALFAQGIVVQIAAMHSYHDVKIAVLTDEGNATQWAWTRWLPHVFSNEDRDLRMVGSNADAIHDIVAHLDEVVTIRKGSDDNEKKDKDDETNNESYLPHYVVICTDSRILESEPAMRRLLTQHYGMTLIVMGNTITQLPKECSLVFNMVDGASGYNGHIHFSEGISREINFEYPDHGLMYSFARSMAPLRVRDMAESAPIPTLVSFLDIYNVRRTENLEVWRMWKENHTYEGLKSVIGYRAGSQPFVLDISDKYHGPHGLIAGTTGSGKSVMLETYILSLALNYSPRQIQFILIDYKGGGMADSFRDLPHVVGVIDNLQGERVIERALASLEGEIKRREHIFKAAKVNNINDYARQYGEMDENSLPHLVIIVDEFAELKSDQPEFMKKLVSASRVGRSLGVHLILSTQKPSNSVSDEIWANSRFHLCLRVQTRQDSMEMLKRPDAAFIKGMGRCFIQIGNDELFDEVQTSYSGLAYKPDEPREEERPQMLSMTGQVIKVAHRKAKNKENDENNTPTQMQAVLERVCEVAKEHGMGESRAMWLPEMPAYIRLRDIKMFRDFAWNGSRYPNPQGDILLPVGIADDVDNQRYLPYVFNLTEKHNLMLVGMGGKTTAIQSMVYALCSIYDPSRVSIHILSYTSRTLGVLSAFPQVGDILFEGDVIETKRMLNMLTDEMKRRIDLFAEAATDSFVEYNAACIRKGKDPVPAIIVMIDRYEQLNAIIKEDDFYSARMQALIQDGSSRGIHFIATANAVNEISPAKVRAFFGGIALQMNNRSDYSEVINARVAPDMPMLRPKSGRGFGVLNGKVYEIQFGVGGDAYDAPEAFDNLRDTEKYAIRHMMPVAKADLDANRAEAIVEYAKRLDDVWKGTRPQQIRRIPQKPTWDMLFALPEFEDLQKTDFSIPIGYDVVQGTAASIDITEAPSWMVYGPRKSGISNFLKLVARVMQNRGANVHVIGKSDWKQFADDLGIPLHQTFEEIVAFLKEFIQECCVPRKDLRKAAIASGKAAARKQAAQFTPNWCILIDNAEMLYAELSKPEHRQDAQWIQGLLGEVVETTYFNTSLFIGISSKERAACQSDPIRRCIGQERAIALGGKLNEFDVCNIGAALPSRLKSPALPKGYGFMGVDGTTRQIIVPLAALENE